MRIPFEQKELEIQEITGMDLDDTDTRLLLQISIRLLEELE